MEICSIFIVLFVGSPDFYYVGWTNSGSRYTFPRNMKQAILVSTRRYGGQQLTMHSSTATMTELFNGSSTDSSFSMSFYVANDIKENDYVSAAYSTMHILCVEVV